MAVENITTSQEGVRALLTYTGNLTNAAKKQYLEAARKLLTVANANKSSMGADEGLVEERVCGIGNQVLKLVDNEEGTLHVIGQYSKNEAERIASIVFKKM